MMILAVTVLFAIGGVGPSLHWAEITADKCLYGEALRILDEVPTSEQRTRAAQMLRARLLACVRALRGDVAEAAALIRMSWHAGFKDPDQLRSDPMLGGPVVVGSGDLPSENWTKTELRISLA